MNKFFRKYKVLFGIYTIWITIHIVLLMGFGGGDGDYFFPFTRYDKTEIKFTRYDKTETKSIIDTKLGSVKYNVDKTNTDLYDANDINNKYTETEFIQLVKKKYPIFNDVEDSLLFNIMMTNFPVYKDYIKKPKLSKLHNLETITVKPLCNPFADLRYYDISEFIVYCLGPVVLVAYCYFLSLFFKKEKRD